MRLTWAPLFQGMKQVLWYGAGDGAGVFDIDWQRVGDIHRFAFVLESEKVGVADLTKIPELVGIRGASS
jgi:hypothetical protein